MLRLLPSPHILLRLFSLKFSRQFSFLGKMNLARNLHPTANSSIPRQPVGAHGPSVYITSGANGGNSHDRNQDSHQSKVSDFTGHPNYCSTSDSAYEEDFPSLSASISSGLKSKRRTRIDLRSQFEQKYEEESGDVGSMQLETTPIAKSTSLQDDYSLPTSFGKKRVPSPNRKPKHYKKFPAYSGTGSVGNSVSAESFAANKPFDICFAKSIKSVVHQDSSHRKSRKMWISKEHSTDVTGQILRPGMVLLKTYITLSEQVKIVKNCRELGLGPGGFYQPSYRDGAKLRLQMMCLGKNWDPETRKYEDRHPIDGSKPPCIPRDFILLVERAIQDSHVLIKKDLSVSKVEEILPGMSPDLCIANFYKTSGRLGLHQDRDESLESRNKGLPVVSFSFGDSAEFLYGNQRDVEKAEKVLLESGDVLIFGGESRHVFHGVRSIIPNSAPPALLGEASLRPGRLNLTFRQY
ncbi:uncharacterized protein LOC132284375 [Cornus florida]|uniref:uncharacterized protein LOC132284375 n=1 Tax=Cornus florida TaxID=4283 RepID=UPI0028A077EA|nr:uncharacterized protein LOC132284375 [Cornus florida]